MCVRGLASCKISLTKSWLTKTRLTETWLTKTWLTWVLRLLQSTGLPVE